MCVCVCVCPQRDHIIFDVRKVFAVDALASSHPLSRGEEEVNQPSEISEMFNTISYSKVLSHTHAGTHRHTHTHACTHARAHAQF